MTDIIEHYQSNTNETVGRQTISSGNYATIRTTPEVPYPCIPIPMTGPDCDMNNQRYVAWGLSMNDCYRIIFDPMNIRIMSEKLTEMLMGVAPNNQPIIVSDQNICFVLSQVYEQYRPMTGDIDTRYNVPNGKGQQSMVQEIIDQAIAIIYDHISSEYGIIEYNKSLTKWTTLLGDFNAHNLRSHPPIKILNKKPDTMQFNMNY